MARIIYLELPNFSHQRVCLKISRLFFKTKVYQDGIPIKKKNGKYFLENNLGQKIEMELKRDFLSPIPYVLLDNSAIYLTKKLNVFGKILCLLPIITFLLGGVNIVTFLFVIFAIHLNYWMVYKVSDLIKKILTSLFITFLCSSISIYIEILILSYLNRLN